MFQEPDRDGNHGGIGSRGERSRGERGGVLYLTWSAVRFGGMEGDDGLIDCLAMTRHARIEKRVFPS